MALRNIQIERLDIILTNPFGFKFVTLTKKQRKSIRFKSSSRKYLKKMHNKWLRKKYKSNPEERLENYFKDWEY